MYIHKNVTELSVKAVFKGRVVLTHGKSDVSKSLYFLLNDTMLEET